jgi:putative protease
MRIPEILAPAGSFAALRAAVWAGADAVYLGGQAFNARANAANFGSDELREAVILAHRAGVKVYVTVNTLLKEAELPEALNFLGELYNLGVDAAIVQDLGLANAAQSSLPQLELHASTQCTTTSVAGAVAMASMGFKRVVLARELSSAQVREINTRSPIDTEVFLHGALCVAYSGQCLYSSLAGGRSGNRGMCAQSCRLPSRLLASRRSGHLLSPRDLNLLGHIPMLAGLGVAALKIEGRARGADYVAEVVSIYRRALDDYASNPQTYAVPEESDARLRQAFNREFTAGLLLGESGDKFYNPERPGNQGLPVGKVAAVVGDRVRITLERPVTAGDVLAFLSGGKEMISTTSRFPGQTLELRSDAARGLRQGESVIRLFDSSRSGELRRQYEGYAPSALEVSWRVSGAYGAPLVLDMQHGKSSIRVESELNLDYAQNEGLTSESLSRQLSKLGDTPFVQKNLAMHLPPGLFLPVSEINSCRRRAVSAMLTRLFGQSDPVSLPLAMPAWAQPSTLGHAAGLGAMVASLEEAKAAVRAGAEWLGVGREWVEDDLEELFAAYYSVRDALEIPVALRLPRVLHTDEEDRVLAQLVGDEEIIASAPGILHAAAGKGCLVRGDSGLNVFNSVTATSLPLASATLSPELNRSEVVAALTASKLPLELVVHDRTLLMIHENCILGGHGCTRSRGCRKQDVLCDRKSMNFPVHTDYRCRSYLLNARTTSLIGHLPDILAQGAGRLRLELAGIGPDAVYEAVSLYKASLHQRDADGVKSAREHVAALFGDLTRGHWQRGVS